MKHVIFSNELIDRIIADKSSGFTFDALQVKYNLSRTTISRIVKNPEKYIEQSYTIPKTVKCGSCGLHKNLQCFYVDKSKKRGYSSYCKECSKHASSKYYRCNKDVIILANKNYVDNNKDATKIYRDAYRKQHREEACEYAHHYRKENRAIINQKRRAQRDTDLNFKLGENLRRSLNRGVKTIQKSGSAVRDLGCSIEEFKKYIETLFLPGMTWDNWNRVGWHLDHIIPIASFDLSNREQFLKACHYTNYQPLWAKDNYRKGSKIPK